MKKREEQRKGTGAGKGGMYEVLRGAVMSVIIVVILLWGCAVLIANGVLSEAWSEGAVLGVCLLSAGVGGRWTARRLPVECCWIGAMIGAALFLILLALGALVYGTEIPSQVDGKILVVCLCGGGATALLGRKEKRARKGKGRRV